MAVFRVEKSRDYTVMSNHHLRNTDLSLKSKGLLSQMLSLPEEWDYTLKGLSQINREGIDAIREAIRELERAGYVTRTRVRNEKGQLGAADYVIHEFPVPPKPTLENPTQDKPISENPTLENPMQENPTQLNKELLSKELSNTDLLNTHSIPILSTPLTEGTATPQERKGNGYTNMDAVRAYEEVIKDNIEYAYLTQDRNIDRGMLDEIVALMLETVCNRRKVVCIAGDDYPAELVKSKFMKLNSSHIQFVIDCMHQNTTKIRNIKKYLLAVLFNAPNTIDSYYTALVAHDMASGVFLSQDKEDNTL
ncbi:MAG: DUF6017 domain-containing protein [Eubacteriales bacterium]|nr:DUF6017 domain-containing protein [Eubacteriales bacterium]